MTGYSVYCDSSHDLKTLWSVNLGKEVVLVMWQKDFFSKVYFTSTFVFPGVPQTFPLFHWMIGLYIMPCSSSWAKRLLFIFLQEIRCQRLRSAQGHCGQHVHQWQEYGVSCGPAAVWWSENVRWMFILTSSLGIPENTFLECILLRIPP